MSIDLDTFTRELDESITENFPSPHVIQSILAQAKDMPRGERVDLVRGLRIIVARLEVLAKETEKIASDIEAAP